MNALLNFLMNKFGQWNFIGFILGIICLSGLGYAIQAQLTNHFQKEKEQYLSTQADIIQTEIISSLEQKLNEYNSWSDHPIILEFAKSKKAQAKNQGADFPSIAEMNFIALLIDNGVLSNINYLNTYITSSTGELLWHAETSHYSSFSQHQSFEHKLALLGEYKSTYLLAKLKQQNPIRFLLLYPIFDEDVHVANFAVELNINTVFQNIVKLAKASTESDIYLYDHQLETYSISEHEFTPIDTFSQRPKIKASFIDEDTINTWRWSKAADFGIYLSQPISVMDESLKVIHLSMFIFVFFTFSVLFVLLLVLNKSQKQIRLNQKNILRQQNRLQHIQDLSLVAGIEVAHKNNKIIWHNGFEYLFNLVDKNIDRPKQLLNHLSNKQKIRYKKCFDKVKQTHTSAQLEIQTKSNDGKHFYFLIKMFNQAAENPIDASTIILISDITEQKLKQVAALKDEVDYRDLILQSAHDGIVGVDLSGQINLMNQASKAMLNYTEQQTKQLDFDTLVEISQDEFGLVRMCILEKIIQDTLPINLTCWFKRANDERFTVDCRVSPIIKHGKLVGAVYLFKDISLIKQAEQERQALSEQLRHAQKMEAIGQLTGGIAHDFNNILASVLGYAELAQDCIELDRIDKVPDYLEQVTLSGERARDLIKQMMVFSRKESQQLQCIELTKLIDDSLAMIRPLLPSTINIELDLNANAQLKVDNVQFQQLIMNLSINARDAMAEKGTLHISTQMVINAEASCTSCHQEFSQTMVMIKIQDTGTGISKETIKKIFDPYFTTKDLGEGTGMGLSIVHGIVHQLGGHLVVESLENVGSSFQVYLPCVSSEEDSNSADPLPQAQQLNLNDYQPKILIVDDETSIAELLADKLTLAGYKTVATSDSVKALSLINDVNFDFDCIITDQTMPYITGLELAKAAIEIKPELPIILCTGYSDKIDEKTALSAGVFAYIHKPINFNLLKLKLNQAVSHH